MTRTTHYRETANQAQARRVRQIRSLLAALGEELQTVEADPGPHYWGEVGDLARVADSLVEAVVVLKNCEPDELSAELLGN